MARYSYRKTYTWSADLAYIVGLIASDGSLSKDGRHIDFTSKDNQLAELYKSIIKPSAKLGTKYAGRGSTEIYYRVQFSDTAFYDFLLNTGLTPNKSLTMPELKIPSIYFADFLRGEFDGDGSIWGFRDRRWRSSFMYYTSFISASLDFLTWLRQSISLNLPEIGNGTLKPGNRCFQLRYAKHDSQLLFKYMYYRADLPFLNRKYERYLELFALNPYAIKE